MLVDTSSLLNLIELPERDTPETVTRVIGSAIWLVSLAESAKNVKFVLVDIVHRELARQRPKVVERVTAELKKAHNRLLASDAAGRALRRGDDEGYPRRSNLAAQVELLSDLVVRFERVAEVLPVTDRIRSLAHERSLEGRAPAHLGKKDSVADCTIVEATLALAALLTKAGATPLWLLSANTSDFGREELRAELKGVGVEFVERWVGLEELIRRRLDVRRS